MLQMERYIDQAARWPRDGRHILAQFGDETIVVYQAYAPEIGRFAASHGEFGPGFSFQRMSWIKPNFLWMMYRSGWATKPRQETVLAIRIRRQGFDQILSKAVHSTFVPALYATDQQWQGALRVSDVRLQWDPDHGPNGKPLPRRAIQLGLRGNVLSAYAREWIVNIEDITEFAHEQHKRLQSAGESALLTPREEVYPVEPSVARRLGI